MCCESFEHIAQISNTNIKRNADGLLFRREKDVPVDWAGKSKTCVPSEKYKTNYYIGYWKSFEFKFGQKLFPTLIIRCISLLKCFKIFLCHRAIE